ncbi:ribonuclease H-like domain-containing protein [Tanacetum coccineum]
MEVSELNGAKNRAKWLEETVIVNGDAPAIASASAGTEGLIPPKTAKQKLARKNELKAKSTLLLAIPDDNLLKFHGIKDAKTLWEEIKARFRGNKQSKKMQKTILKQQYENFVASSSEGLDKTYDRFQKLISQLEIHGDVISQEDANLKLLRSLPSAWNNIALIMRNKSDLDTLSMDDLYNNQKVYESKIKGQSSSSLNSHNVAFVSSENTSGTNEAVNTAHEVSTASSHGQASSSTYADDVMFSIFANQSNSPQIDNEDLEQIDTNDLEEMDLKWQVAMLTMRVKRFLKKTGRNLNFNGKETVGFDKTKVECYNCHRRGHFARECRAPRNQGNRNGDDPRRNAPVDTSTTNTLVIQDGIGSSSSDSEREALNKSNLEIIGYQMGLESLEARIVVHEKNKAVYKEDIVFLKYDVQVKDISIKDLKNQLEEALKEKDDLKLKLEKFEESSKNLTKLINSQISAKDKAGLGYDSQMNESEVVHSVFNSRESDVDDSPVNDRFKTGEGFHAVPPPYTRNYMPSRPDLSFVGLDDSVYKTKVSKTETSISKTSKDIVEKPKTVRPSAPIIEDWDTDSDNDSVFRPKSDQTKPKFTKINFVKSDENVKSVNKENTHRQVEYPRKSQTVATKSGQVPVNAAKKSSPRAVASISTAKTVNTAAPKSKVNDALPTTYSYFKAHSPDQGIFNSGCSRHMTGNKSFLTNYQEIDGGFVALGGSPLMDGTNYGKGGLTCLFAKAIIDESNLWHKRLGHINFKTINKLVRGNLVRGLPSKLFENDHTCVACQKGKQHKASFAERKNRTLIEAARTMLADSLLPTTFWAEAVNTACYVQNRVLVTKPHNKTPYELLHGRPPSISFMRPFGCPVTILNTLDPLGKFDGKADEGFLVGYSINNKAFRVFNTRTRKVEENLHITFLENKPNVAGSGLDWLFDIELLTNSMNYEPVTTGNQTNRNEGIKDNVDADVIADDAGKKTNKEPANEGERNGQEKEGGASNKEGDQNVQDFRAELDNLLVEQKEGYANSTNRVSTVSPSVSATGQSFDNADDLPTDPLMLDLEDTADLLNTSIFSGAYDDEIRMQKLTLTTWKQL